IKIGGTAATSINVVSATQVTCVTPAHTAGAADVKVTTSGGSVTSTGAFTYVSIWTITSSAGSNGSISPTGAVNVNNGSNQSFAITPNTNYTVADVLVDGVSVGMVSSYTFSNVTANHTINATFTPVTWTIIASAGSNGAINPSGTVSV